MKVRVYSCSDRAIGWLLLLQPRSRVLLTQTLAAKHWVLEGEADSLENVLGHNLERCRTELEALGYSVVQNMAATT